MITLRRVLRRVEPDYDWGRSFMQTMDATEEVEVLHFEFDWCGFVGSFFIGRRKLPRAEDY